ncbi:MAG: bifunctional nuclease family protein, partial [Saprospiraceae bacterium]|nr:bifunctional nuclease family protein [Saprospiraceae bacterium]
IVIGGFEAQAIAVAMERMAPNRPLTHDLFKNTLDIFDIVLHEVIISDLLDGIFYAKLICMREGDVFEIDSRTSDAIAMAVRFGCPIFTYDFILESAGVILEEEEESSDTKESKSKVKSATAPFGQYNDEELEQMLNDVLAEEDYEKAAKIRDELNMRKGGSDS